MFLFIDSYVGVIIGVSVVLGLLCLGLITVVIILLVILCCCEKQPTILTTPTKKNKDLQVYKLDRMHCSIFSRVGDRGLIIISWQFIELTLIIIIILKFIYSLKNQR